MSRHHNHAFRHAGSDAAPAPPDDRSALFARAVDAHRANRTDEAERLYRALIAKHPGHAESWSNLALALIARQAHAEAVLACRRAIDARPDYADAHLNLITALEAARRFDEVVPVYRTMCRLQPHRADLRSNLAIILEHRNCFEEAVELYQQAASLDPASALHPFNRGRLLSNLGRTEEAVAAFRAALAIDPDRVEALSSLGTALVSLSRYDEAAAASRRACELLPTHPQIVNNYAVVLQQQGRAAEAADLYRQAIAIDPAYHGAWANLGVAYQELFRFDEAVEAFERAAALRPDAHASLVELIKIRRHICDWTHYEEDHRKLLALVDEKTDAVFMLLLMGFPSTSEQQLACARQHMTRLNGITARVVPEPARGSDQRRVRVGYLSADYRDHPVGRLLPEMLTQHDRGSVEVFGYALGLDDPGRVRRRIARACDHFVDLHHLSEDDAAARVRADGIDVLVDLTGPTTGSRMGILARRPAPVQVSFLGWPGSMGADCIDYVIGDPFLTPGHHQPFYCEKIVQLPICYQPSDPYRAGSTPALSRRDCGLPDDAFVFCSFNNTSKLTPDLFDLWLRLLLRVDNSVLWLYSKTPKTNQNLRAWAESRGVAADRIVFNSVGAMDVYLGRMRLADLFLDSYPYNAGATCNDALWAGLPVLTCSGETYVSRMAGSLLRAARLPELITGTLADYEAMAVRLATEPGLLTSLKQRLVGQKDSLPLFDMPHFAACLEVAFRHMREERRAARPPQAFTVGNVGL